MRVDELLVAGSEEVMRDGGVLLAAGGGRNVRRGEKGPHGGRLLSSDGL
jgi:hypothetical protein